MESQFTGIAELRRTLIDEIFNAMGFPQGLLRRALWPFAWAPAHRFARLMERFERCNAEYGFSEAARHLLDRFISQLVVSGAEQIPPEGPLLIASNHPGAVDAVAIAASLPRQDLKIVVSGVPFFHSLSFINDHLIYSAEDAHGRMLAVRGAIRHLREGGSVLIFPTGTVDPDPAVFPFAPQSMEAWSVSLALMLNKAPGTRLLVTMVSGVLAPECWRHPLVRLRQSFWEKQKLAEFIQVIQQLVLGRRFPLIPRVIFGSPVTLPELCLGDRVEDIMQAIRDNGRSLMETHRLAADYHSSTGGAAGP